MSFKEQAQRWRWTGDVSVCTVENFDVRSSLAEKPNGPVSVFILLPGRVRLEAIFWTCYLNWSPLCSQWIDMTSEKKGAVWAGCQNPSVGFWFHVKSTMEIHGHLGYGQVLWHRVVFFFPCEYDTPMVLLIAKILHHLGWCWNPIKNGISTTNLNWLAGFQPSTVCLVVSYIWNLCILEWTSDCSEGKTGVRAQHDPKSPMDSSNFTIQKFNNCKDLGHSNGRVWTCIAGVGSSK